VSFDYDTLIGGHTVGTPAAPGAVIVYGSILFDFFTDNNANGSFDTSSERILTHKEALNANLLVRSPVYVNPVLASSGSGVVTSDTDYLAINSYPTGAPSNSLSGDANVGNLEMPIVDEIAEIMDDYKDYIYKDGSYIYNDMSTLLGSDSGYLSQIEYLYAARAKGHAATYSNASVTGMDNNVSGYFIDTDTDNLTVDRSSKLEEPSSADLFHAFLPSGYTHGWKRAMQVTGMAASWNTVLQATDPGFMDRPLSITANRIDTSFADIPAVIANGGHVRFRGAMNVSGLVYSSGSYTFEQSTEEKAGDPTADEESYSDDNGDGDNHDEADLADDAVFGSNKYISGAVLTGFGQFYYNNATTGDEADEDDTRKIIISHDHVGFDQLPVEIKTKVIKRTHAQIL